MMGVKVKWHCSLGLLWRSSRATDGAICHASIRPTEKRFMPDADLWYVMLADGDVHRVTLDQLDEAFQAGHIDQETLVLAEGARQWTQLGKLAGLDETPPPPRVPVTTSFRPVSVDLSEVEPSDLDFEDVAFRTRSGKKWFAAVAAIAVVGTIAGVATTQPWWARGYVSGVESVVNRALHRSRTSGPSVAAVSPPPMAPESPAPVVASPSSPGPVGVAAVGASGRIGAPAVTSTDHLSPDLKQKLLEADKRRDLKAKARARNGVPATSHTSAKNKFGGFTTGGNKYDPLNSAIQ
jgi:hypothetical protein